MREWIFNNGGCDLFFQGIQQVSLRRLSTGSTFGGDSIVLGLARDSTIVTQEACELLRVESNDFHSIWQVTKLITPTPISTCAAAAQTKTNCADVLFYIPWRGRGVANLQQRRQNRNGKRCGKQASLF